MPAIHAATHILSFQRSANLPIIWKRRVVDVWSEVRIAPFSLFPSVLIMASATSSIKIGGYSEGHLLQQAKKVAEKKASETPIFNQEFEDRIPKFDPDELKLGKVLGRGGFCKVSEVVQVALKNGPAAAMSAQHGKANDEHLAADILQDRDFMHAHFLRKGKDYRYAIKKLKEDATKDVQTYINGIVDLAIEARFLAVIRHPK